MGRKLQIKPMNHYELNMTADGKLNMTDSISIALSFGQISLRYTQTKQKTKKSKMGDTEQK